MPLPRPLLQSTVLVVEDDEVLRMCAAEVVAEASFSPVEAADADEAVAILESRSDIALVFTDIQMPGSMDGLGPLAPSTIDAGVRVPRPSVQARGASLVSISQQTVAENAKAHAQLKLGFPILSDRDGRLAQLFGVRWGIPELPRDIHRESSIDLSLLNGDESCMIELSDPRLRS